jgi:cell division septation protein DedD
MLPDMMRFAVLFLLCCGALPAQEPDTSRAPRDSVIILANQFMQGGREADGRRLIDSVLRVTTPDSAVYAEALYWRASHAATAADAERDYRRLLIESPLAARAEDALLQLAQLEQARGDKRGASDHLQRFMLTYAKSPARPRVALSLVRLLFEQGPQQQARACEALRMGRESIPPESLELRNQLEFYAPRCAVAEAPVAPAPVDSAPPPPVVAEPAAVTAPVTRDTTRRQSAPARTTTSAAPRTAPTAFYSVQVAAYDSREPAARMAKLLVERGLAARVDGTARPFRVRVGKYSARSEAVKAQATLKAQGHNGFITLVNPR